MVLGFILPFALAFVAIPLEAFVKTSRTVGGYVLIGFLLTIAFFLRLIGSITKMVGGVLINLYDLIVFGPLWLERMIQMRRQAPVIKKDNSRSAKSA